MPEINWDFHILCYTVHYGADYTKIIQYLEDFTIVRVILIPRSQYRDKDFYDYNGGRMTTVNYNWAMVRG